jgi:pyridoxal phosphate enzyme (YggS family)
MTLADNIARVQQQITDACRRTSRAPESVMLMAVSKTHSAEAILEAAAAGIRLFGENRVQEFAGKRDALAAAGLFAGSDPARFHCIGPLQSNKVNRAAEIFDAIDTVDSLRLAQRLDQAAAAQGKTLAVHLEIKTSPETAKHGIVPDAPELAALLEQLPDLKHLRVRGLMTVPPFAANPEEARPYFRRLRELRDSLAAQYPRVSLEELSMGMSHDFPVAIEEGATVVRVGTAIFGARPPVART